MSNDRALTGMRVLELCEGAGGAWCGKILADLGADVRKAGPADDSPKSFYLNMAKRPVADDMAQLRGLLSQVDVVIEDLTADRRAALGADAPSSLVWCSITPFGTAGPYAGFKGQHLNICHAGSEGSVTPSGEGFDLFPDRPPLQFGGGIADYDTGVSALVEFGRRLVVS